MKQVWSNVQCQISSIRQGESVNATQHFEVAIVVARERTGSPWAEFAWRPVEAVFPAPATAQWSAIREAAGAGYFLAGVATLELHRKEAESYLDNLAEPFPSLYVVLRQTPDEDQPLELQLVTASLTEAHAYGENGDEIVGPVAMPEAMRDLVGAFAAAHFVDEPFVKRKRRKHFVEDIPQFGQEPIFAGRGRVQRAGLKGRVGEEGGE